MNRQEGSPLLTKSEQPEVKSSSTTRLLILLGTFCLGAIGMVLFSNNSGSSNSFNLKSQLALKEDQSFHVYGKDKTPTSSPTHEYEMPPSDLINLTDWGVQLPVNETGGFEGTAYQQWPLTGYINKPYFYTGNDYGMVLWTPYNGALVGTCSHPRNELFEVYPSNGDGYWWNISTTYAKMKVHLEVNQLGNLYSGGESTVIVGQIHGVSGTIVRLYYNENGTMYWEASIPKGSDADNYSRRLKSKNNKNNKNNKEVEEEEVEEEETVDVKKAEKKSNKSKHSSKKSKSDNKDKEEREETEETTGVQEEEEESTSSESTSTSNHKGRIVDPASPSVYDLNIVEEVVLSEEEIEKSLDEEDGDVFGSGYRNLYSKEYLVDSNGDMTSIPLDSKFHFTIETNTTHAIVSVVYKKTTYSKALPILFYSQPVHFKAGSYCQTNNDPKSDAYGYGGCIVTFYSIEKNTGP